METFAEYYARVQREQQQQKAKQSATLAVTMPDSPDEVAGASRLAEEYAKITGKPQPPVEIVRGNASVFQREIDQRRATTILSSAPRLADWMADPNNAVVAKDDLEGLSWWETKVLNSPGALTRAAGRGTERVGMTPNVLAGRMNAEVANDIGKTYDQIYAEEAAKFGETPPAALLGDIRRKAQMRFDMVDGLTAEDKLRFEDEAISQFKVVTDTLDRIQSVPMSEGATRFRDEVLLPAENSLTGVLGAFASDPTGGLSFLLEVAAESLPQLAASGVATAVGGPMAGVATMGAGSFLVESQTETAEFLREKGLDLTTRESALEVLGNPEILQEASDRGLARGLIVGVLDAVSGGIAGQQLAKSALGNFFLQAVAQSTLGGAGEAGAQLATEGELNWADVVTEALAEFATTPIEIAAMGGGKLLDLRRRQVEAREAEDRQNFFKELSGQAVNSKLRERMPEAFRRYLDRALADGPVENVYIPADKFNEYFQSRGIDPLELVGEIDGVTREDIEAAIATGGDIKIPTATYAAKIAGSEHDAFLMQNMRTAPDQMTAVEAQEFEATKNERMAEVMAEVDREAMQATEAQTYADQIMETVSARLVEAGTAPDVASAQSVLWRDFYVTQAARAGITMQEMLQQYPLPAVRGDIPQPLQPRENADLARILADARAGMNPQQTEQIERYLAEIGSSLDLDDAQIEADIRAASGDEARVMMGQEELSGWDGDPTTVRQLFQDALTPAPRVEGQSTGVGNKHGLQPHLRVESRFALPAGRKPLFAQTTMNTTAPRQIAAIDEVLSRHPDPTSSPEAWTDMLSDALASADVPVPPYAFIRDLNGDGAFNLLNGLSEGQIADADHGFENARMFREAYLNGEISVEDTGRLFMWSFLSRGVSPYVQESLFIDAFDGIGEWISAAADGSLSQRLNQFEEWARTVAPKGSGQPGAGATHNLNAFGKLFLIKMSQDADDGTGRSRLQVLHDMMSDPASTGQQVRRKFLEMGEGVGIDNKVVSFTLLVAGYGDVMVLDRVQIRQLWNDGRFDGINLYDGYKDEKGKPVNGSALSSITYGARGLLVYEAIERALQQKIGDLYARLGRPEAASVGRYHWETWVASSQQEASHGTIDAILSAARGAERPMDGVTAKEGEYGAYAYGARYGRDGDGTPFFLYSVPGIGDFRFDVVRFGEFLTEIKSPKNGVIPKKFKVTESGNGPWYQRDGVNIQALGRLAGRFGSRIEVPTVDAADGIDQAVPGGPSTGEPRPGSAGRSYAQSAINNALNPQRGTGGQPAQAGAGGYASGSLAPLAGAPRVEGASGPDARLVAVAEQYARANGIELRRQAEFVEVDPERAARIAAAYEAMPHAPQDPAVKEAYQNLIQQTVAQYRALEEAGYVFYFFDDTNDPYGGNPWNAMRDLRANQRMAVYATEAGFGSGATELNVDDNPMLADTGIEWGYGSPDGEKKRVLANDLFRAVHDAFGHGIEGAGFRARGEENAWQAHVRLFTGSAVAAITTETRGQNSWLNYGPYGEQNRTAAVEDTVFADQKTGLMPAWTWEEGRAGDEQPVDLSAPVGAADLDRIDENFLRRPGYVIFSATRGVNGPWDSEQNAAAAQEARDWMARTGTPFVEIMGRYEGVDDGPSFIAIADEREAKMIARKFGQDSVLTNKGLIGGTSEFSPVPSTGEVRFGTPAELEGDYFSILPDGRAFTVGLNFDYKMDLARIPAGFTQRPDRPQLPIRPDGMVELVHWSNRKRSKIDPSKAGTGPLEGPERRRDARLSFFGINPRQSTSEEGTGYVKEMGLGPWRHTVAVDPDELYPWFEDPDGLKSRLEPGEQNNVDAYENLIREAGYIGYYTTEDGQGSAPLGNAAALFEPVAVESVVDERAGAREYGQGRTVDVDGVTLPLNPDGTVTLYHGTTAEAAQEIIRTGSLRSAAEPSVYLTTAPQDTGYGDGTVVAVDVTPSILRLDDEFPDGRADFAIDRRSVLVSNARPADQTLNQNQRGSIQIPAAGIQSGQVVINLMRQSDLSTFLHESGHFFLLVKQDMAEKGMTSAAKEMGIVRSWWRSNAADVAKDAMRAMPDVPVTTADVEAYLDNGTTGDIRKDAAIDIGTQEQWARGLEAYLMEGRAPSAELRSVFAKFRAWLISIYRSATGLNVEISPEIRAVFDRMFATDQQIMEAKQQTGDRGPLFKSAQEMGLSPEDYERYREIVMRAEDEANARLQAEIMDPIRRAEEKKYRDEREGVRAEVETRVNARREYRAIEWMGNRRWLGEDRPTSLPDIRIDKQALVDRYGPDILKQLPRGQFTIYTVEGGASPDDVAGLFGFRSGDEMIQAIGQAQPRKAVIEAETDAVMFERYGDPLKDGTVADKALEALHNGDTKARALAIELDVLNARPGGTRSAVQVFRQMARETLARTKVRDAAQPNRFLAAERRAADQSYRLFAAGDLQGAAEAKRRQLLNHLMYTEARKISDEVDAAQELARKLQKKSVREKLAGDYLDAIDEVLQRHDFRQISNRDADRRGALLAYVQRMTDEGRENELAIPERVLQDAQRTPFRQLTVEHLRGVVDTLKNIEHTARLKKKLQDARSQRDLDKVVESIVAEFDANLPKRPPGRVGTTGEAVRTGVRQFFDLVLNATTLLREIDGFKDFGPAYRNIKSPIDAAMNRLQERRQKAAEDLDALYEVYTKQERRRMADRQHIPEIGMALSKWERIGVALNMGNEGNYQRLTDTRVRGGFTEDQVRAIVAGLDARDAQFVQSVWDYLDTFRADIEAREKRTTGVAPKWVEARPVEIAGVTLRGGYYPLKYDARLSSLARDDQMAELNRALQGGRFGKAQTKNGHLKERAASSGRTVDIDISVLHRHVQQVVYDLELSEPVANAWKILQDSRIRGAFTDAGKQADFDALETWVLDVGTGEIRASDPVSRNARRFKSNFTAAKLAFNLSTVAVQITGVAQSMVVVGKADFLSGVVASMRPGAREEMYAKSIFMRDRSTTFNKDIFDLYNDPKTGPVMSRWSELRNEWIAPAGLWLMTKVQMFLVDAPTWMAGYQQGLRKFNNDEAQAIAYADDIVKRAQASGLFSDRSAVERGSVNRQQPQSDFIRLFTALGSYMFQKFNVAYERTQTARRVIGDEGVSMRSAQEALSWAIDVGFLFTLEAVLYAAIKGRLPDEEDDEEGDGTADEWASFLTAQSGLALMSTIPFVRDMGGAIQGFSGGGAYGSIVEEMTRPLEQAMQGEADLAFVKSVINATGLFAGIPSSAINRVVEAGWRQAEGEDVSPAEYLLGRMGP